MKFFFILALIIVGMSFAKGVCDAEYNQCITQCCASCGSTLATDSSDNLACDMGTESDPKYDCVSACLPCSNQYQKCLIGTTSSSNDSCCGSALILGAVLGFAFLRK